MYKALRRRQKERWAWFLTKKKKKGRDELDPKRIVKEMSLRLTGTDGWSYVCL